MGRRSRLAALVVAGASFAGPTRGAAADPTGVAGIPVGVPVALDGRPLPAEWEDAASFEMAPRGPRLRLKQYRGTLLVAASLGRPWPRAGRLSLYARPGAGTGSYLDDGASWVDFEPFDHSRPHTLVYVRKGGSWERLDGRAVFRASSLGEDAAVEGAVSLDLWGVEAGGKGDVAWLAVLTEPGRSPSFLSWPQGLDVGAAPGVVPADLASTSRWARATRFPGAPGPGAFSPGDWDAWVAADREVATRGDAAHALARTLLDEMHGGQTGERPKKDAPIREAILDNLAWIAEREALTQVDVRAIAAGLWALNRGDEALARLRTAIALAPEGDVTESLRTAAVVAQDLDRFEEAARLWDALAARLPERMQGPYLGAARTARTRAAAYAAEAEARRADAARDDLPLALLETSKGDVLVLLLEDDVPESVRQFVHLAEEGKASDGKPIYDGTLFHRVVAAGLAQGGDPKSRIEGCGAAGSGGCPWWIAPEKNARHGFWRGAVGFAMKPDRKVHSQFFVMTAGKPAIGEAGFSCFGTVVAGMDVVDRLEACDTLRRVRILRKRDHPYVPTKRTGDE